MSETEQRFVLVQDNDAHWYVIPADKWPAWDGFCGSPHYGDDDPPEWAKPVGGHPRLVTFTDPRMDR